MLAPKLSDYIKFEPDFGPRVLVFVDTEEDFDWSQPMSRANTSVSSVLRLERAQSLFQQYGVKPCYLVDYPIATAQTSIEVLRPWVERGLCTIGTQLHPWVNPPYAEEVHIFNSYPGNLAPEIEHAKLANLTAAITRNFGVQSTVYRAGRYGIGPSTPRILRELGYRIDTSVRPNFDYSKDGGANFTGIAAHPYWATTQRDLLEIPLSVTFTGALAGFGPRLYPMAAAVEPTPGVLARLNLLNRVTLTPEGVSLDEARAAIRTMAQRHDTLYCLSFHSPSVEPGHTPYVRNDADLERFYAWLAAVLDLLVGTMNVRPADPEDVLAAALGHPLRAAA